MVDTLRVPTVWLGITAFGLYSALEVAAGVWTFTLLTEGRGLSVAAAGGWTTAYFSGMFAGRLALGTVAGAVSLPRLLRFSGALSLLGAAAFSQAPGDEATFVGLALLGVGLGPIFPTLISATPSYVGAGHTSNAIGFQLAAGALGGGLLPVGIGAIAAATNLEAISVALVLGCALLLVVLWMFASGKPSRPVLPLGLEEGA
jgi:fucose permease